MVRFTTEILKFGENGEKTGWTYFIISAEIAEQLNPGNRKSFRVRGKLDHVSIECLALIPLGEGDYILPLNLALRKSLKKKNGNILNVELEFDPREPKISEDLLDCLSFEPLALEKFQAMPRSHQNYYSNWVNSCKTEETKVKRINLVVSALIRGLNFAEMIRENRRIVG